MLANAEIMILEKGLDFALIQRVINEAELTQDFNDFCRRMCLKLNFRDETQELSETSPKSTWNPRKGHPFLEVFLSQLGNNLLEITKQELSYSNLSKEAWRAIRSLANDRPIVIKKGFVYRGLGQNRL